MTTENNTTTDLPKHKKKKIQHLKQINLLKYGIAMHTNCTSAECKQKTCSIHAFICNFKTDIKIFAYFIILSKISL